MLTSVRSVSSGGYGSILTNLPQLSLKDWSLPGQFLYNKFYVPEFVQRRKNAKEKTSFKLNLNSSLSLWDSSTKHIALNTSVSCGLAV